MSPLTSELTSCCECEIGCTDSVGDSRYSSVAASKIDQNCQLNSGLDWVGPFGDGATARTNSGIVVWNS